MNMNESVTNLGIFGNKKSKIQKFDKKNRLWGEKAERWRH